MPGSISTCFLISSTSIHVIENILRVQIYFIYNTLICSAFFTGPREGQRPTLKNALALEIGQTHYPRLSPSHYREGQEETP
jgi:hypothetical protein